NGASIAYHSGSAHSATDYGLYFNVSGTYINGPGTGPVYIRNANVDNVTVSNSGTWFAKATAIGQSGGPWTRFLCEISNTASTDIALDLRRAASQSALASQIRDNSANVLSGFDPPGRPFLGASPSFGGGTGPMMFLGNDTADPSSNPIGGTILYSTSG